MAEISERYAQPPLATDQNIQIAYFILPPKTQQRKRRGANHYMKQALISKCLEVLCEKLLKRYINIQTLADSFCVDEKSNRKQTATPGK